MGYVDLHSHVLPALDDGSKSLDESTAMMRLLQDMGFDTVHATPHQKKGFFVPARVAIDDAAAALRATLPPGIELKLGAENFWDELFVERAAKSEQPTYTGGKAFLFELPVQMCPPNLEQLLFTIRLKGLLPVMAHPERYAAFWTDPHRLQEVAKTCALVVDLAALDGQHGVQQGKAAQKIVLSGLAHAVTSDIHSPSDARGVGAGITFIRKKLGDKMLTKLLDQNPRDILRGELPEAA